MAGARQFTKRSEIPEPRDEVFAWHERRGALSRLLPPWEPVAVEREPDDIAVGSRAVFRTTLPGPVRLRWVAELAGYDPPNEFRDIQLSGPFAEWEHRHRFEAAGDAATLLTDEVSYRLPPRGGFAGSAVASRLERMFAYRHRQLAADLAAHRRARERGMRPLHVAVTGASGLIGGALTAFLTSGGHRVTRLVRRSPAGTGEVSWDPSAGFIDAERLRDVDAVVHLAGAPIAGARWSPDHKRRVRDSRVQGTRLLAETLAGLTAGPGALICGSAIGFYGSDRGDELLTEDSARGTGFLAGVAGEWEAAADPARQAGIRVVHVRTGIVQSPRGGALRVQLPLFRLGLGGRLGSGGQWVSWIGIDDIVGIFHHALANPDLAGVINGTAPHPVTNAEHTAILAGVLGRPAVLPVPGAGPAVLLGREGARETAFASQRVLPGRAEETGYRFRHRDLESALRHVLGRTA
ncbi:MAG: TIGR01777 family oxidoreductase [Carbonactinosporaceae bacterium]